MLHSLIGFADHDSVRDFLQALFSCLDTDNDDEIEYSEFLWPWLRLRGSDSELGVFTFPMNIPSSMGSRQRSYLYRVFQPCIIVGNCMDFEIRN